MKRFFYLILSAAMLLTLCSCADGGSAGSYSGPGSSSAKTEQLTQEQLDWFQNTFFSGEPDSMYHSQFLTSLYDTPADIDLYQLLYNGTGAKESISKKEEAALSNMGIWGDTDCTKNATANIDEFLQQNTGLSLVETSQAGLENLTYLPDYDAYYFYHGDTNAMTPNILDGWNNADGSISLTYGPLLGETDYRCVTLNPQGDDTYWFVSNVETFPADAAAPETPERWDSSSFYDSQSATVSCEIVTDAAWKAIDQDIAQNYSDKSIARKELTALTWLGQVKSADGAALDVYQADYALLPVDWESVTPPSGTEIHCGQITGSWTLTFDTDGQVTATVWTPSLDGKWQNIAKQ